MPGRLVPAELVDPHASGGQQLEAQALGQGSGLAQRRGHEDARDVDDGAVAPGTPLRPRRCGRTPVTRWSTTSTPAAVRCSAVPASSVPPSVTTVSREASRLTIIATAAVCGAAPSTATGRVLELVAVAERAVGDDVAPQARRARALGQGVVQAGREDDRAASGAGRRWSGSAAPAVHLLDRRGAGLEEGARSRSASARHARPRGTAPGGTVVGEEVVHLADGAVAVAARCRAAARDRRIRPRVRAACSPAGPPPTTTTSSPCSPCRSSPSLALSSEHVTSCRHEVNP